MMTDVTRVWKAVVEVETSDDKYDVEHLFSSDLTAKQWAARYIDVLFNTTDWECIWRHDEEPEGASMSTYIDGKHILARVYACKVHP